MTFAVHVQGGMRLCGCGCGQVAPTATKTHASHAHWHASNGRIALPMEAVAL